MLLNFLSIKILGFKKRLFDKTYLTKIYAPPRGYFFGFSWNVGWRGGIRNCPKIKIDWYFFVEIETNKKIRLKSQGCVK